MILVTGGTGAVIREFARQNVPMRALVRSWAKVRRDVRGAGRVHHRPLPVEGGLATRRSGQGKEGRSQSYDRLDKYLAAMGVTR